MMGGQKAKDKRQKEMGRLSELWLFVILFLMGIGTGTAKATSFHLIVCGSGGEEPYVERFDDWGKRLRSVLVKQMGQAGNRVYLLTEQGKDTDGISELGEIEKIFRRVGQDVSAQDDVFVYLVGHGSYRRNIAKLNIPGADFTVEHLNEWMRLWPARRVVIVNTASSSAAFVNKLSGKGRIVCASTRSVEERNATRFMEFFVQALEEGSADQNRDERISMLEICRQAASLTEAWYTGEGYLATEHAILDDNGDGKGARLAEMTSVVADGKEADQIFILDTSIPEGISADLVDAYQAAITTVQDLVKRKQELDLTSYYKELEQQLLKAAQLNRQIRQGKDL
jgi:hypothetical protein